MTYITLEDYLKKMTTLGYEPTPDVIVAATELLAKVNGLLEDIGAETPIFLNSGWRAEAYNATIPNAARLSKHITGHALDIRDDHGFLYELVEANLIILKEYDLCMEHRSATKGWLHLQSVPVRSGNLIFYP